jgi:translation initiation factor IF-1
MKQKHISVIPGDWVKVEVNQYDMTQGRIVYRYNSYDSTQNDVETTEL